MTFHYSDIAPDGGKILLTGGLPIVRGSDEERLLRAALAIVQGYEGPLEVRAGLNAGRVFVHDAGTRLRRVYTIRGDSVNLGARVMAHAEPFQVLATDSFLEHVNSPLRTTPLPPFMAKGKSEPVVTSAVAEVLDEGRRAAPSNAKDGRFVGRQDELSVLARLAHRVGQGHGSVADIVAEPGFGKSTLVSEAADRWSLRTLQVVCESYGDVTPYRPFRHLLLAVLGVRHDSGYVEVVGALDRVAGTGDVEVRKWLPLLGALFDITLPSTPQVDQLDPKFRRERLEEAVVLLLDQLVTEPVAFIFEDLHAADDSTRSLVARMAVTASNRPWFIVVTRRPEAERWYPPQGVGSTNSAVWGRRDANSLINEVAEELGLMPNERAAITERAAGSPLFLRELLEAYRASRSIEELPDTLEPLLASQVDRLDPADRSILRAAAVLGVRFMTLGRRGLCWSLAHSSPPSGPAWRPSSWMNQVVAGGSATPWCATPPTRASRTVAGVRCTAAPEKPSNRRPTAPRRAPVSCPSTTSRPTVSTRLGATPA